MRKNTFFKILAPGLATVLAALSCGEEDSGNGSGADGVSSSSNTNTTGTGTGTGSATGTNTAPGGTGTTTATGTTSNTANTGGMDTGGGATTTPDDGSGTGTPADDGAATDDGATTDEIVPEGPAVTCTDTPTAGGADNELPAFDGVQRIFLYGDGRSALCVDDTQAMTLCAEGTAWNSDGPGGDYEFWGAGFGLQMADTDANGDLVAPFDATAAGIAGVKFTVTGVAGGAPIRVQMGMVDDPAITTSSANYEENGFVWGGGASNDLDADGEVSIMLTEFEFPEWTTFEGGADTPIDLTRLHSLQFQVVTAPEEAFNYNFCVSNFQWVDADGNVVDAPEPSPGEVAGEDDMATDDMVTDDMATDDMVTDDMATDDMATDDMATDDMATDDMATDDMATDDMATDDMATDDMGGMGGMGGM